MDDDFSVMKYINIVPLDEFQHCTDIQQIPVTVKIENDEDSGHTDADDVSDSDNICLMSEVRSDFLDQPQSTAECESRSDSCDWEIPMHIYLEQHAVENTHECELCHWTFSSDSRLAEHKQLLHCADKSNVDHNPNRSYNRKVMSCRELSIVNDKMFGHRYKVLRLRNTPNAADCYSNQDTCRQETRRSSSSFKQQASRKSSGDSFLPAAAKAAEPSPLPLLLSNIGQKITEGSSLLLSNICIEIPRDSAVQQVPSVATSASICNSDHEIGMASSREMPAAEEPDVNDSSVATIKVEPPSSSPVQLCDICPETFKSSGGPETGVAEVHYDCDQSDREICVSALKVEPSFSPLQLSDIVPDTFRSSGDNESDSTELNYDFDPNDLEICKDETSCSPTQLSGTDCVKFTVSADEERCIYKSAVKNEPSAELNYDFHLNDQEIGKSVVQDEPRFSPVQISDVGPVLADQATYIAEPCYTTDSHDQEICRLYSLEMAAAKKLHECNVCLRVFNYPSRLADHMQVHSSVKQYVCGICNKAYVRKNDLKKHKEVVHIVVGARCEVDNITETNYSASDQEIINACSIETSDGKKSYKCDQCCKVFDYPSRLIEHKQAHSGLKPYECWVCGKAFTRNRDLKRHVVIHTPEESTSPMTSNAEEPLGCEGELLRQKATRPRYPCEMCNKTFGRNGDLNRHRRTHTASHSLLPGVNKVIKGANRMAKTLHVCEVCDIAFSQPYMLARHKVLHSTIKPHTCDICHRSFNYQWNLNVHKRIHASAGAAPYSCNECGRLFYRKCMLDEHMLTHSGETPHKCEYCPKSFRRPHDLQMHRRNHTGNKPFECTLCQKSFSRKNVLVNHVRVHTGDRQYRCEICDRAFIQRSTRDNHRRTHSRDKPYKCYLCDRAYARSRTLVEHIRVHTTE